VRFLERVFALEEREAITQAADPDLELWYTWAAKETCYKIASKLRGEPPAFVHAAFVVSWQADAGVGASTPLGRPGLVQWEDMVCSVLATHDGASVHAIGCAGPEGDAADASTVGWTLESIDQADVPWSGSEAELRARLTPLEDASVHSRASAAVRIGARQALASDMGVAAARVEIVGDAEAKGRRPPRVLLDGQEATADVSLSHDGDWIAWAWSTG
jgi:hypothetical protein